MSSHHFVKEGQEPALVIIDPIPSELVEPLLEWSPLLVVYEDVVDHILEWGIKIDVVIGHSQNEDTLRQKLLSQTPVKILSGDSDTLETVLYFLMSTKHQAVTIVTANAEPLFGTLNTFLDKLSIILLTRQARWSGIATGSYKKWLPKGAKLMLDNASQIQSMKGLSVSGHQLEALEDGLAELVSERSFWVGEAV
jgi:hypothetical protein